MNFRPEPTLSRRGLLSAAGATVVTGCAGGAKPDGTLMVGDQRGGSRVVLSGSGEIEGMPYKLKWAEFPNAAPLLEALSAGAIDTGGGGDSAFIFAIGSHAPIKAIGAQKATGFGPVILVRRDSPIRTLGDLAGKRVATPRGSISHNHVLAVLEAYGQPYDVVRFAFLSPSDGRAALQGGSVDAWAIWDPYAAFAEKQGARILPGKQDLVPGYSFIFGRDGAITEKRPLLADYRRRLFKGWIWANRDHQKYVELMHEATGTPVEILQITTARTTRLPAPIDAAVIAEQQRTADRYLRAGVIAHPIDVRKGFDTSFV